MQKNLTLLCFRKESITKIFLRMKLLTFFMLIAVTSVSAISYSQPTTLTFNFDNVTVSQVFREIERNSDYILIYNEKTLDINRKVTVIADNDSIETILSKVFAGTRNSFKIYERQIVILGPEPATSVTDTSVYATELQQVVVTGTIKDAATGEPLPGVTIMVKGTTAGTLSDVNGKFSVAVPGRDVLLIFSFIGYTTMEMAATPGTDMNIIMSVEVTEISEVVVVGYGVQKKESVVGAITQINNAAIMKSGTSNITNALAGKLSGVLTIQDTGEPGVDNSEIIIRGLSSWNGSQPLILVDGVERDFTKMDPNEISTISVLKDASATAVFGAKGANGVIVITSKRGTFGKPKFDFSASVGMQKATRIPAFIDSYTTMRSLNAAHMNEQQFLDLIPDKTLNEYRNPSTPLNALLYPNVNWFDEVTKPFAPITNANLNISGGTEFVKYFLSLGYEFQGDFIKGMKDGYINNHFYSHRFNYRINVDFSLTKSTLLSLNVGGAVDVKNSAASNDLGNSSVYYSWRNLYVAGPSRYPAYYPAWALEIVPDTDYPNATGDRLVSGENPYTSFSQPSFNRNLGSKLFTDVILKQKLDNILEGLSVNGKISLSTYYSNNLLYMNTSLPVYFLDYAKIGVDANGDGIVDANPWKRDLQTIDNFTLQPYNVNVGGLNSFYSDLYYELSLNYANSFGKHNLSGLALLNRQQKNTGTAFPYYNEGLVGRATYDYDRKYLLELNVGYTGSERFAPKNRFGFFPSAAIGWVVSQEQFFKNAVPWMSKLKFRYTDGLVGSDYAQNRWLYNSTYYKDSRGYIHEDLGANISAQWEMAHKRDLGIEMGFIKNVFTLSVDLFDEYRDKMLLTPQSVTMLVGNTFKELNLGKVKKHGFEIEAEFRKSPTPNFEYFVGCLFVFNENRVIYRDDLPYMPEYMKKAGKPLTYDFTDTGSNYIQGAELQQVQLIGSGYLTSIDDIHTNSLGTGNVNLVNVGDYKYLDYNADGIINIFDRYPGKGLTYPPITWSLSSGFKYKNFNFNFLFHGNIGKYIDYNQSFELEFINGSWSIKEGQLDYWMPNNPDAGHSTLHYLNNNNISWGGGGTAAGFYTLIQGRFFRNADYIRLKELYAGYTFSSEFFKKLFGASNLQVYATGNDLLVITKLLTGDPERKNFQGGYYPIMSTMKLGVKVTF